MASRARKPPKSTGVTRDLDGPLSRSISFAGPLIGNDELRSRQGSSTTPSTARTRAGAFRGIGEFPSSRTDLGATGVDSLARGLPEAVAVPERRAERVARAAPRAPRPERASRAGFSPFRAASDAPPRTDFRRRCGVGMSRRGVSSGANGLLGSRRCRGARLKSRLLFCLELRRGLKHLYNRRFQILLSEASNKNCIRN